MSHALSLATSFIILVLSVQTALAQEVSPASVTIPLKEIWALGMPSTRDIRELDPRTTTEPTAITKIGRLFTIRTGERKKAGNCFIVKGEGKEALQNATKVLVDGTAPMKVVPANEDVSLVFYSYAAPGYVHIDSVRHSEGTITISYKVVTHPEANMTVHFALIPLGKLAPGRITVTPVQVEARDNRVPLPDPKKTERAVCDSCTFAIEEGT